MRPTGEVTHALLAAAGALASPGHGATLRELAAQACVGMSAVRTTVPKLTARGFLEIVNERQVDYRNRRVAEYVPVLPIPSMHGMQPPRPGLAPGAAEPRPPSIQNSDGRTPNTPAPMTWETFV